MDEVTQIGDEKMLGRVATEWREVCRWDEPETPAFKVADKPLEVDWQATAKYWEEQWRLEGTRAKDADFFMREAMDYQRAFTHALAAFEELAGEHRELEEAFFHDAEVLSTPCPGDPEDYTFVRAYYRPRRSKAANSAPCEASPTGDKEPATNPPNTSSGEATGQGWMIDEVPPEGFGDGVTVWACENCHKPVCRLDHECIPQSGEERSEERWN